MIEKGTISTVSGKKATVIPSFSDSPVSIDLVVPFYLVSCLEVGMPVVYAQFEDNTGVILARMDGEWNHDLEGDVNIQGNVTTTDMITGTARFNTHTHTCPDGGTSGPQ